uniref:Uncharacterized protein n=2 Tax=Physcomitrium patens TaxID=3218 RepID=A0A7I4AV20_PHYPA
MQHCDCRPRRLVHVDFIQVDFIYALSTSFRGGVTVCFAGIGLRSPKFVTREKHVSEERQLALNKARQDKQHAELRMAEALKRMEEAERHWKIAEKREKFASEAADQARNNSSATEKEKLESQRLAVERLAAIER